MAYIDNPYANSLRQEQAMPAVQQALGGYEGGMDGLMRLFQQQYSRPQQQTPQFGGLGSMNSGGMGYGNMFPMQNERMPQPQYQPYASPYQQQYPQPQSYGGYGRQQQYGGYGGGYGGMQSQYQPQQYGGGGQQYGGGYGNHNNYQSYGGQNQARPMY